MSTKWLDFGGGGTSGTSWLEYRLPRSAPCVVLLQYDLVSANDSPERDPYEWCVEGLVEAKEAAGGPGMRHAYMRCMHHAYM